MGLLAPLDALHKKHEAIGEDKFNDDGTYKAGINQVTRQAGGGGYPGAGTRAQASATGGHASWIWCAVLGSGDGGTSGCAGTRATPPTYTHTLTRRERGGGCPRRCWTSRSASPPSRKSSSRLGHPNPILQPPPTSLLSRVRSFSCMPLCSCLLIPFRQCG
jgi:hypothetical protein